MILDLINGKGLATDAELNQYLVETNRGGWLAEEQPRQEAEPARAFADQLFYVRILVIGMLEMLDP